jgi:hypothetical protein
MARQFLTGLDLNKNQLLNARIQNLASAPDAPVAGQIYYNTGDNTLRYYNGTSWLTLAQGGSVEAAIEAAIDLITTDAIEEGSSNLYFTDARAKTSAADLLTGPGTTLTNITITGDGSGLTITAENGVADSTTSDLAEGTNLYFTDERAQDAVGDAVGDGLTYNDTSGAISVKVEQFGSGALGFDGSGNLKVRSDANVGGTGTLTTQGSSNELAVNTSVISTKTYADGAASSAVTTHNNATSGVHGVDGDVVGDTDSQTLTNKTLGSGTVLSANVDADQNKIVDLAEPTDAQDAATKNYVDTELGDHSDATTGVHGVTGDVVGTSDEQTLTNKTLGSDVSLSADLDADNNKIINVATPTADTDAANKAYVDNAVAGLTWKQSVNLLATSDVELTGDTETLVIDGHAALDSADNNVYRVLLIGQTTDSENGIYLYTDNGTTYTLVRSTDADSFGELDGATVFISEGTTYGQSAWTQSNHYLTDFTNQDWVQFSGAAQITAGTGLTKTGNTLDVVGTADRITVNADSVDIASTYVGQSSITTLGTITTGVWNGTDIAVADGGTGSSTAAGARANLGATTKYTEANPELTQSGGAITWVVEHNLGIRTVVVQVYTLDDFEEVEVDVERTNTDEVTLRWVSATNISANSYQVVIIG